MAAVRRRHGDRVQPARLVAFITDRLTHFLNRHDLKDPVTTSPTRKQKASHVVDTPFQVMYIMADLHSEQADDAYYMYGHDELVLCTIKVAWNAARHQMNSLC